MAEKQKACDIVLKAWEDPRGVAAGLDQALEKVGISWDEFDLCHAEAQAVTVTWPKAKLSAEL
jgi:hypothetical protein